MNKKEVQKRVSQNGEPLALDKFEWDEKAEVFSTTGSNLVLDFKDVNCVTFTTGFDCTFDTGSDCTFDTSFDCTFDTSFDCTFDTGSECVVIRRDVYEVIELKEGVKIKLNGWNIKGYKEIPDEDVEIIVEGKTTIISRKSAVALGLIK